MGLGEKDLPRLTAEEVFTPWEMVGASRRDSKPHRARFLRVIAYISVLAGGASVTCMMPGLVGLPLGLAAWRMACRDLNSMRRGDMDTDGFHQTEKARSDARVGTILSLVGLMFWSLMTAVVTYLAVKH
jgi:hypothetical protein